MGADVEFVYNVVNFIRNYMRLTMKQCPLIAM